MRRTLIPCAALFVGVLFSFANALPASAEGDRHSLRFKFGKGETVHYAIRQQVAIGVQFNGVDETAEYAANSIRHFKVLDVDSEGTATLELMIDRCYMSSTTGGQTVVYDSTRTNEPVPPEHLAVAALIGRASVQIKVSPVGAIPTKGIIPLLGQPEEKLDQAEQKLDILFALPDEAVGVGEAWNELYTAEVVVAPPGMLKKLIKMERRYKLTKVEGDVATIDVKTVILSPDIPPDQEAQLIQKQWMGEVRFDIAAGRMLSRTQKVDGQVAGFDKGKGLLTVKSSKTDVFAPAERLAGIDLSTLK